MLKTEDKKTFFTYIKNFQSLLEFSKVFGIKLEIVEAENPKILELKDLAVIICDYLQSQEKLHPQEKTKIKTIRGVKKRVIKRGQKIKNARKIRNFIRTQLKSGKNIELRKLQNKFNSMNLSLSCFCNHMRAIREELQKEGFELIKPTPGCYKIARNNHI